MTSREHDRAAVLKVDLHAHTRHSLDSNTPVDGLIERAREVGLDRLAVTDHGEIDGALEARELDPELIIVGEEIRCRCGTELIGLFLRDRIPEGLGLEETAERIGDQGGVVYVPHPYAYLRGSSRRARRALAVADVVEVFNSRAFWPSWNRLALEEARSKGLPLGAGSDAHFPGEIGRAFTQIPEFRSAAQFREALPRARPVGKKIGGPAVLVASHALWAVRWTGRQLSPGVCRPVVRRDDGAAHRVGGGPSAIVRTATSRAPSVAGGRERRDLPSISVVVPCFRAADSVASCVDALLSQRYPRERYELIFVDNDSPDATGEILRSYGDRLRVGHETVRGAAAARNAGVRMARHDLVAFTDADCVPTGTWLAELARRAAARPDAAAVGGRIVPLETRTAVERFAGRLLDQREAIERFDPPYVITANCLMRRTRLLDLGLFDVRYRRGQDAELSFRDVFLNGATFAYAPRAIVHHRNPSTIPRLFWKGVQHGQGASLLTRDYADELGTGLADRLLDPAAYRAIARGLAGFGSRRSDRREAGCDGVFNLGKQVGLAVGSVRAMTVRPRRVDEGDRVATMPRIAEAAGFAVAEVTPVSELTIPGEEPRCHRLRLDDGSELKARFFPSVAEARRVQQASLHLDPRRFPPVVRRRGRVLFTAWVPGRPLDGLDPPIPLVAEAGAILGELHARSSTRSGPSREPVVFEDDPDRVEEGLAELARSGAIPARDAERLTRVALDARPAVSETGLIHADFCARNLLLDPDGRVWSIDNETLDRGFFDYDLARSWYRWPLRPPEREAFYQGYARFRSLESYRRSFPYWAVAAILASVAFRRRMGPAERDVPMRRLRDLAAAAAADSPLDPALHPVTRP